MAKKRFIGAALLAVLTMGQSQRISDLAPADEYFGRSKISILELRHKALALKDDLHKRRRKPDDVQHNADALTDAFYDWARRFPHDGWLPRTGWELATLYEELPGVTARDAATELLQLISSTYPASPFADQSRKDLARGIGVRSWPTWAGREPAASPAPTPTTTMTQAVSTTTDTLLAMVLDAKRLAPSSPDKTAAQARAAEDRLRPLMDRDNEKRYARHAWELATLYEMLPGNDNRERAIKMLAVVLDRYAETPYGAFALGDLKRGVGAR